MTRLYLNATDFSIPVLDPNTRWQTKTLTMLCKTVARNSNTHCAWTTWTVNIVFGYIGNVFHIFDYLNVFNKKNTKYDLCNIRNVFMVNFDRLNVSLLNKSIHFFWKHYYYYLKQRNVTYSGEIALALNYMETQRKHYFHKKRTAWTVLNHQKVGMKSPLKVIFRAGSMSTNVPSKEGALVMRVSNETSPMWCVLATNSQ